jgi:hypothetical protein
MKSAPIYTSNRLLPQFQAVIVRKLKSVLRMPNGIILLKLVLLISIVSSCSERFRHSVQQVPPPTAAAKLTDYSDSTITLAAGKHYDRSWLHNFFYGKHYRNAWYTPIQAKVLDIGTAKGGLKPMQLGGSRQTINLRLVNPDGIEYVLRSIDKEPASVLSEKMQQSYFANIIRDATSATHPYAALTIPTMAKALNIYHMAPELVYVPHDPRLGHYVDSIGGSLALLERRPDGDQSDNPLLGRSKNIKSTRSALTDRLTDNDSQFNARYFLRARLLDMLLGDWSRHEDNWRWAEHEHTNGNLVYKAIPRDRDNVYYKLNDAPIPKLFMLLGFKPHFQTFQKDLKNLEKLNRSGRNLDEIILAELELNDWLEIADSVKTALTDEVLEEAIKKMPENIYQLTGPSILSKLKSRRDQLPQAARDYFNVLATEVLMVGTDKHELFVVNVRTPKQVQVQVYKLTKEGKRKELLFERMLYANSTKEIKLYGLGGDDKFEFNVEAKPDIKIFVKGGAGEDTYKSGKQGKLGNNIKITDSKYRNSYKVAKDISVTIDDNPRANEFDAEGWLLRYYLD